MLNKSNVNEELLQLKNDSFIIDYKLDIKEFYITTLENNVLCFNTDYSSFYEFSSDSCEIYNVFIGKTFESFESILSTFSKKYSQRFNELLAAKLEMHYQTYDELY